MLIKKKTFLNAISCVIICIYFVVSGVNCQNDRPFERTLIPLASALGGYAVTNKGFPLDPRGEDYALYRIREVMQTDSFCEQCTPPFLWDHSNKKVYKSKVLYYNKEVILLPARESDRQIVIISKGVDGRGVAYAIDNGLTAYCLRPVNNGFRGENYIGRRLVDVRNDFEIVKSDNKIHNFVVSITHDR